MPFFAISLQHQDPVAPTLAQKKLRSFVQKIDRRQDCGYRCLFCYWDTIATEVIMHYEPVAVESMGVEVIQVAKA